MRSGLESVASPESRANRKSAKIYPLGWHVSDMSEATKIVLGTIGVAGVLSVALIAYYVVPELPV